MTVQSQSKQGERESELFELLPAERIALTVARAQLLRDENPPINITTVLVMALDRVAKLGEGRA